LSEIPSVIQGLRGLEETRRLDFEQWLDANRLDAIAFPACADVGPFDSDYNPISNEIAWRNGVWVSNGNQVFRHLGIPAVTVTMGLMSDTNMPVGLTFAGKACDDDALLRYAYAFDSAGSRRIAPLRTPALQSDYFDRSTDTSSHATAERSKRASSRSINSPCITLEASISPMANDGSVTIGVRGSVVSESEIEKIMVFINGESVPIVHKGEAFSAQFQIPSSVHYALHSRWRGPYGSIVTAIARDKTGSAAARFAVVGGIA
jgi:amidase